MAEGSAAAFVKEVEEQVKPLSIATGLAAWEATTTGTQEAQAQSAAAESALKKYLSSGDRFAQIQSFLSRAGEIDPLTRRQLELLAIAHQANQLPAEVIEDLVYRSKKIEAEFHNYRARLDGRKVTDNEIIAILRGERDLVQRRAAWEASKQIASRVADDLIELVRRRNDAARSLGYRDFYAMQLALQEIDERQLFDLFGELKERTDHPFRVAKAEIDARLAQRYGLSPNELRPWHYADPFFQEPPLGDDLGLDAQFKGKDLLAIASSFYEGVNLPIADVLERSDLEERPGKDQHAYCIDIDREGDVRILCNIKDDDRWMGILLHELGHAAYDKYISASLSWTLREPAHIAVTEAIALFMDRLIYDTDWLAGAAGIRLDDPVSLQRRARSTIRFEMLLMARWVLVMTFFERELYANPDREHLDPLWWDLVEELQLLRRPEGRSEPDWASKIHLSAAPVYYHNYQVGELIASQLGATLREEAFSGSTGGYVGRGELGDFLQDRIFSRGASLHWQELLKEATGSELAIDAFVNEFVAEEVG